MKIELIYKKRVEKELKKEFIEKIKSLEGLLSNEAFLTQHKRKVWAKNLLAKDKNAIATVMIAGDKFITQLNLKFRGVNHPTDVLAFPEVRDPFNQHRDYLGDIAISLDTAKQQACRYRNTIIDELIFLVLHGLLHLLGVKDDTRARKKYMLQLQKTILSQLEG